MKQPKFDKLAWQRAYRARNKNAHTRAYEKSIKGFLMRVYRNMQSRVTGVQALKAHLYLGKELLEREAFYAWATADLTFQNLFTVWKTSGYDRKLCPSVNRIDSDKGYTLDNIEWVTHSENSRQGSLSQQRKKVS